MYGSGILAVSWTVPITDEATVVLSVNGAPHQLANTLNQLCLILPGVVVALVIVIVVVLEEAANTVDVDVATVLRLPVATQEHTVDTTLFG